MSELRPCAGCRRHVAINETACPFCGAPREASAPALRSFGRMSRAAVFAGAALGSGAACGGKKPKTETQTIDNQQTQSTADAGVDEQQEQGPNNDIDRANPDVPMPYGAPPARRRVV